MNTLESNRKRLALALVLAALVALPAIAEEALEPELATMTATAGTVNWAPRGAFDKLVLTVEGGGFVITREFSGGQPFFVPVDPDGYTLPDGTYTWELTAAPRARSARGGRLGKGQQSPDGRSAKASDAPRARVQSGAFTIVNGAVVDPGPARERHAATRPGSRDAAAADIDDTDSSNQ